MGNFWPRNGARMALRRDQRPAWTISVMVALAAPLMRPTCKQGEVPARIASRAPVALAVAGIADRAIACPSITAIACVKRCIGPLMLNPDHSCSAAVIWKLWKPAIHNSSGTSWDRSPIPLRRKTCRRIFCRAVSYLSQLVPKGKKQKLWKPPL